MLCFSFLTHSLPSDYTPKVRHAALKHIPLSGLICGLSSWTVLGTMFPPSPSLWLLWSVHYYVAAWKAGNEVGGKVTIVDLGLYSLLIKDRHLQQHTQSLPSRDRHFQSSKRWMTRPLEQYAHPTKGASWALQGKHFVLWRSVLEITVIMFIDQLCLGFLKNQLHPSIH